MKCRFCDSEAVGVFALDQGCACFPDDRLQPLCMQHIIKVTPIGDMVLKDDLTVDQGLSKWWKHGNQRIQSYGRGDDSL